MYEAHKLVHFVETVEDLNEIKNKHKVGDTITLKVYRQNKFITLKIVLGEGRGQNWWCVMFPPVCFVEGGIKQVSDKEYEKLKNELGKTAFEIVTGDGSRVMLKFKIVEIVNDIIG